MSDEIFYRNGRIIVSRSLVKISSSSYSVSNIGSVSIRKKRNGVQIFFGIVFALVIIALTSDIASHKATLEENFGTLFFCTCLGLLCLFEICRPKFHLILRSSSSEMRALTSRNRNNLRQIQQAIETAIADGHSARTSTHGM